MTSRSVLITYSLNHEFRLPVRTPMSCSLTLKNSIRYDGDIEISEIAFLKTPGHEVGNVMSDPIKRVLHVCSVEIVHVGRRQVVRVEKTDDFELSDVTKSVAMTQNHVDMRVNGTKRERIGRPEAKCQG